MLPDVAAEALRFLTRRELDNACGARKWLDAMIARSCDVFPLRSIRKVALYPCWNGFTLKVSTDNDDSGRDHSFKSLDDAAGYAVLVLRRSYVGDLQLGFLGRLVLRPDHWTMLVDAVHGGVVRDLRLYFVDASALDDDALLAAVDCRGLHSLSVERCDVPSGFVTDALIRASNAKGVRELCFLENNGKSPPRLSEDAVMDFFFTADAAPEGQSRALTFEDSKLTDMFVANFFERLHSSLLRPSGGLVVHGAAKQRGLAAFSHFLMPDEIFGTDGTYRFPSVGDTQEPYDVHLYECSSYMYIRFNIGRRSL